MGNRVVARFLTLLFLSDVCALRYVHAPTSSGEIDDQSFS